MGDANRFEHVIRDAHLGQLGDGSVPQVVEPQAAVPSTKAASSPRWTSGQSDRQCGQRRAQHAELARDYISRPQFATPQKDRGGLTLDALTRPQGP